MIYQLELKNCVLSKSSYGYIDKQLKKVGRYLPNFVKDLPLIHIYILGHTTKGYFDGSMVLHLPKQALNAHFKSASVDNAIKFGFKKLRRELRNYKGRHFVGDSEYPSRENIFDVRHLR